MEKLIDLGAEKSILNITIVFVYTKKLRREEEGWNSKAVP